jgi:transposase
VFPLGWCLKKLAAAVRTSGTSLAGIFGVRPVIAGTVIGDVRQVSRFSSRDHFAACNGTAPVQVSFGGRKIYRLSLRGNRPADRQRTWPLARRSSRPPGSRAARMRPSRPSTA